MPKCMEFSQDTDNEACNDTNKDRLISDVTSLYRLHPHEINGRVIRWAIVGGRRAGGLHGHNLSHCSGRVH